MSHVALNSERMRNATVLVVGDLMLDNFVYGDVGRISPEAPIPVLNIKSRRSMVGGAANVTANVAALEGRPIMVGVIGNDAIGNAVASLLGSSRAPVVSELVVDNDRPTTVKTRYIAGTQQVLRVDEETAAPIPDAIGEAVMRRSPSAG